MLWTDTLDNTIFHAAVQLGLNSLVPEPEEGFSEDPERVHQFVLSAEDSLTLEIYETCQSTSDSQLFPNASDLINFPLQENSIKYFQAGQDPIQQGLQQLQPGEETHYYQQYCPGLLQDEQPYGQLYTQPMWQQNQNVLELNEAPQDPTFERQVSTPFVLRRISLFNFQKHKSRSINHRAFRFHSPNSSPLEFSSETDSLCFKGAVYWVDSYDIDSINPRSFHAIQSGVFSSLQVDLVQGGFWLDADETVVFYRHLIENAEAFPPAPDPFCPNPLPEQEFVLENLRRELLGEHSRLGWAKAEQNVDWIQGHGGYQYQEPLYQDNDDQRPQFQEPEYQGYYYQDHHRQGHRHQISQHPGSQHRSSRNGIQCISRSRWEENTPAYWSLYREQYPDNEAIRCERCKHLKRRCTHKEKRFPCDECESKSAQCVRQEWHPGRRVRDNAPQLASKRTIRAAERARKVTEEQSAVAPKIESGKSRPPEEPNVRCERCVRIDNDCEYRRPCQVCVRDGVGSECRDTPQSSPFIDIKLQDESGGNKHPLMCNANGTIVNSMRPAGAHPQFNHPSQNFGASVAAEARPHEIFWMASPDFQSAPNPCSQPPSPFDDGSTLSRVPQSTKKRKRPAVDVEDVIDDHHDEIEQPRKRRSADWKQRRKTTVRVAKSAAAAIAQSQMNFYDPPKNDNIVDTLNPPGLLKDSAKAPKQLPAPRQTELVASTWKIEDLPAKKSTWHDSTSPPKGREKCTQDLKYWVPGEFVLCDRTPTKGCQWANHSRGFTDQTCHNEQNSKVRLEEKKVIDASKLLFCEDCFDALHDKISDPSKEVKDVHWQICQCTWQMTRTWLCNTHRVWARQAFARQVGLRKQAWLETHGNVCAMCHKKPPLTRSRGQIAWICCACEAKVFYDPMVAVGS